MEETASDQGLAPNVPSEDPPEAGVRGLALGGRGFSWENDKASRLWPDNLGGSQDRSLPRQKGYGVGQSRFIYNNVIKSAMAHGGAIAAGEVSSELRCSLRRRADRLIESQELNRTQPSNFAWNGRKSRITRD